VITAAIASVELPQTCENLLNQRVSYARPVAPESRKRAEAAQKNPFGK
jgi:hypothetical protein